LLLDKIHMEYPNHPLLSCDFLLRLQVGFNYKLMPSHLQANSNRMRVIASLFRHSDKLSLITRRAR
jgi:hypothetical protein